MDVETKLELIRSAPFEEAMSEQGLKELLETKSRPVHYIGMEISGMPHIGTILVNGKKVNDFDKAGIETQILLADWHTMANNKLGGDWERIIKVAGFYKRLFNFVCPNTKVVMGSDLYRHNDDYWRLVVQLARRTTMARATRTLVIQGRSVRDTLHVSQYLYPVMQVADINALGVDIPHAGIDQRKVHALAKELFKDMRMNEIVPVHHHLLPSLAEPPKVDDDADKEEIVAAMKMSKSKPGSSVPILSTEKEVKTLLGNAWCPAHVEMNPVLELYKYLIFPSIGSVEINRPAQYGGDVVYESYRKLEEDFLGKKLHPVDLKNGAAKSLWRLLAPINERFGKEKEELNSLLA
ncbi:MAG: tyrosine--tRNA ligase [Candidatus Micrarchaeota archaeon]|nr:tyrosine--tRNA ligase [Candidatus Micrarchaeota archaeon]